MSLSTALHAARSGLHITSRAAQVVADNIANSQTPGYGVRSVSQAAQVLGGAGQGVALLGLSRHADPALHAEFRDSLARHQGHNTLADFWNSLVTRLGEPGATGSLDARISQLESALAQAATTPDSVASLQQVARAADALVTGVVQIDSALQGARDQADAAIAEDVDSLNRSLAQIARLNDDIQRQTLAGRDTNALKDQRQLLIDQAAAILPLKEVPRRDGQVMLLGADGTILLDREPAHIGFTRTPQPAAEERVEAGALGRIEIDGRALGGDHALLASGRLGAALHLRDVAAPRLQEQLDGLASDLVARFAQPDIDPTLPAGEMGLIVENHGAHATPGAPGAAGRLALNPLIDPDQPDSLARLRDGLYATLPGPVGDNAQLARLAAALKAPTPSPLSSAGAAGSVHGHAAELMAGVWRSVSTSEDALAHAAARHAALDEAIKANGVDTDSELQHLMTLEKAYAANARVMATVDAMLRQLMEI